MLVTNTVQVHAQAPTDKIHNKDGTIVQAKVLEILPNEIKYKKASNPDGPTYTILKSDVTKIVYANGEEEKMATAAPAKAEPPKEEIPFGADNFLTFSNDGTYMMSDLTLDDKKVYLCQWDFDMKLKGKYLYENRQVNAGIYHWQTVTDNGSFLLGSTLYDKNKKAITTFINPNTKEVFNTKNDIAVVSPSGERVLFKTLTGVGDYSGGTETIYVFDGTGKLLATNKFTGEWIKNMRFSHSDNKYLLVRKSNVIVFDANGNQTAEIEMKRAEVTRFQTYNRYGGYNLKAFVNFSSDDQYIISPDDINVVGIWDTKGTLIRTFHHPHASHAAISPDGKWVVTAGCLPYGKTVKGKAADGTSQVLSGGQIKVWSIEGTLVKEIRFPLLFSSIEFTPNNSGIVAIAEEVPIWLWAEDDYSLEEGMDVALDKLAVEVAAAKEAKDKADRKERWGIVLQGFVDGLPKALNNMSAEAAKADKQRKRVSEMAKSGPSTSGTGTGAGTVTRKGDRLKIVIDNNTSKSVESVYISPKESKEWSNDILGKDVLLNGENSTLTIPGNYGKGCSFDLKVVYPDGKTSTWTNLDFCKYYTFKLSPNGKVVFSAD